MNNFAKDNLEAQVAANDVNNLALVARIIFGLIKIAFGTD